MHYHHILNNEITKIEQRHPCEDFRKKHGTPPLKTPGDLMKVLSNIFGAGFRFIEKEVDNKKDEKFFEMTYKGNTFNIYVEHTDSGGMPKRKKISIPFNKKIFLSCLENLIPVLVIDFYYPLIKNEAGITIDENNFVLNVVKPSEVYGSKARKTKQPSSRWSSLQKIKSVLDSGTTSCNDAENVYIIRNDKFKDYFDSSLIQEEYRQMTAFVKTKKEKELTETAITNLFREKLIRDRNGILKCDFCGCEVKHSDLLVASHIWAKSNISKSELSKDEKIMKKLDPNNGFLLCRTHDCIFDRKYITFSDKGELIVSEGIKGMEKCFNIEGCEGKQCVCVKEEQKEFLKHHREEFEEKNKKMLA